MGGSFSFQDRTKYEEPDRRFVVVPPLLEADFAREEAERFAMSGYEWCTRMPQLRLLLLKHMQNGARSTVNGAPSDDMLLYAAANLENLTWDKLQRSHDAYLPSSTFKIRQGHSRYSFLSLCYRQHKRASEAPWASACICGPGQRWAAYAHMPLRQPMREMLADQAYGGVRVGSKTASMGAEVSSGGLQRLWGLAKVKLQEQGLRHLLLGAQVDCSHGLEACAQPALLERLSDAAVQLSSRASVFGEYTLGPPSSSTTIHIAATAGSVLKMAAFHHIARVRRVYNLFEDDDVVGVCNYLDFGIQVLAPLASSCGADSSFEAAASWQVNTNLMVKAAASAKSVTAALVLKSWWNPRFTGSLMAGWDLQLGHPCLGCHITIDNDDAVMPRYQRGYQSTRTGSLVREMHVATRAEVALADGDRIVVPHQDSDADAEHGVFMNSVGASEESGVL